MSKKWHREATYRLLRYGRKNDGGWTDADLFWNEETQSFDGMGTVPDDNDIDLVIAAPDLLAALERIATVPDCGCVPCRGQCESAEGLRINAEEIREIAREAIKKAKGVADE